jgi:cellulose synthase/poly-beta-1,6-N-acetylglucosamine synthase-like glycosyltransferase
MKVDNVRIAEHSEPYIPHLAGSGDTAQARALTYFDSLRRPRFLRRLFEIIPGALTWTILLGLLFSAIFKPVIGALLIITFDLYWMIRVGYITLLLVLAYRRLRKEEQIDWIGRCKEVSAKHSSNGVINWREIYHLVIFPVYTEGLEIIEPSLQGVFNADYPNDRIIVIVAFEERRGRQTTKEAAFLEMKYSDKFFKFATTVHPDGIPGEVRTKGANATWAARHARKFIDEHGIDHENVIVSCFDSDTIVQRRYFACLTYHYMTNPKRTRCSYQPIPVYNNNIWEAAPFARIAEIGSSFWQMVEAMRPERLVTFSSHSMSFKTLVDVGYWPVDMISDDSAIYWRSYLYFHGDYAVVPMYVTVSMDVACSKTIAGTFMSQYRQKRRWAWGIENFPVVAMGFLRDRRLSLWQKVQRIFQIMEDHITWATWAVIISVIGPIQLLCGGFLFKQTAIGYNLPNVTGTLLNATAMSLVVCVFLSRALLPPRPRRSKNSHPLVRLIQWLLIPFTALLLGSIPAIDAQTRLMLGANIQFQVTEKARSSRLNHSV